MVEISRDAGDGSQDTPTRGHDMLLSQEIASGSLKPAVLSLVVANHGDIPDMVHAGERFFSESEMRHFTTYDPDRFQRFLEALVGTDHFLAILAYVQDELVGGILLELGRFYTTEALAHMFVLWVAPPMRGSQLGRMLVKSACDEAKNRGCTAFYAGSMAGVSMEIDQQLMRLLQSQGFKPLGGIARKVL